MTWDLFVFLFLFFIRENNLCKLELLSVSFAAPTQHQEPWQTHDKNSVNISGVTDSWTHLLSKQNLQWLTHMTRCFRPEAMSQSWVFLEMYFFPRKLHTQQWPLFLPSRAESWHLLMYFPYMNLATVFLPIS